MIENLIKYIMGNIKDYKIATLGSHSALQILKGAKDEGFSTICICQKGREKTYKNFLVADELIVTENVDDFFELEEKLLKENVILIPHGSFVEYLGYENLKKLQVMYYGTKEILDWESNRDKERIWLEKSKLRMPKIIKTPEEITGPSIIKFHGAGGGKDYFVANNTEEFYEGMEKYKNDKKYVIQEYIVGVPIYAHYFYSAHTGELEIMGFDKRYESNADSIGRIAAKDQLVTSIKTSYTICGNIPIVIRESLLPEIIEMGERVVAESRNITKKGLMGPFCLEAIIDPNLNFFVFEISARIVAGTNPYTNGSPYTWIKYDVPMSTGRRIARDIKMAIESDSLDKILD